MPIRPANRNDIPSLIQIEQQSETAAHWNPRAYGALFDADAPIRKALVASDDAEHPDIWGFLIAVSLGEEWEIENLVVALEHRRRGIGSQLLRQLLRDLRAAGAQAAVLEVRESNLAARRLYEKYGFSQEGRRPGYYQDPGEDALLLRRELQLCDNIP